MKSKISAAITGYRLVQKQSGRELAREIGISPSTLSSLERGKIVNSTTYSKVLAWLHTPITQGETQ